MESNERPIVPLAALKARVGSELGVSDWHLIDQQMVDRFADATDDHQYIHVDPVRAAQTPFGGTIAHGFLTLSMLSVLLGEVMPKIEGTHTSINYGFDRIRFISPVKTGARIRGRFVLKDVTERGRGEVLFRNEVTVEIEGATKPALIAEWLGMAVLG
jgi:acyl dehydratase